MKHVYLLEDPAAIERGNVLLHAIQDADAQITELSYGPVDDADDTFEDSVELLTNEAIEQHVITLDTLESVDPKHYAQIGKQVIRAKLLADATESALIDSDAEYWSRKLEILRPVLAHLMDIQGKPVAVESLLEEMPRPIRSYRNPFHPYPKKAEGYMYPAIHNTNLLDMRTKPGNLRRAYIISAIDRGTGQPCVRMAIGE